MQKYTTEFEIATAEIQSHRAGNPVLRLRLRCPNLDIESRLLIRRQVPTNPMKCQIAILKDDEEWFPKGDEIPWDRRWKTATSTQVAMLEHLTYDHPILHGIMENFGVARRDN